MLGFDATGSITLGGLPYVAPPYPPLGIWTYYDWSAHPGPIPRTGPEINSILANLLPGLFTQAPLQQAFFVPEEFYRHPPPPPHGAVFDIPNLLVTTLGPVQLQITLAPRDFFRHPPPPPHGAVFDIPNLLGTTLAPQPLQFFIIPRDFFRHPPPPQPPQEAERPDLQNTLYAVPASVPPEAPIPFIRKALFNLTDVRQKSYTLTQIRQGQPLLDK